jgi:RNA polymerase sigma-70 factor (ECF subfamily)
MRMDNAPDESEALLSASQAGDESAWRRLQEMYSRRVRRMVELRMDPRLRARVDPSDVIQESFLDAWRRLDEYVRERPMPFFLWLRFLTGQRLISLHRHHFGAQKRDPGREHGRHYSGPGMSSVSLARRLFSDGTSPSQAAVRAEEVEQLRIALDVLDEEARELLGLRHFEHLSNAEAALVLNINESTASTRYLRAIRKLKGLLENVPGFLDN